MAEETCCCVHFRASHPGDGPCTRTLAAVDDPENDWHLPEWRCPCQAYRPDGGRLGGVDPARL